MMTLRTAAGQREPPPAAYTYERVACEIAAELRDGFWRDGDMLPSECAFSVSLGVSRKTIRRALDLIERDGLIDKARGRNSVVRDRRIEKIMGLATDFSSEARKAGLRPRTRLDSMAIRRATIIEAARLGLSAAGDVLEIVRTRLVENLPAVWQTSVLPARFAQDLSNLNRPDASLYGEILNKLGIEIARTEDTLTITTARAGDADRLKVLVGEPVVRMRRLASARDGEAIELSTSLIRPQLFKFQTCQEIDPSRKARKCGSSIRSP
jgi:GntR family transcriptional regulator